MISLRPLIIEDADEIARWGLDRTFRAAAGWSDRSFEGYRQFHRDHLAAMPDDQRMLGITDHDQLVGFVEFYLDGGSCELGIAVGPSSNWSRGYGRRAIDLASRYAITDLGIPEIWAETHPANVAARRMLLAAGFVESGDRGGVEVYDGRSAAMITYVLPGECRAS